MTSLPPFDKQLAQEQVRKVYRGELTTEEAQLLQVALIEHSDDWEEFLSAPSAPHELESDEADALLQARTRMRVARASYSRHAHARQVSRALVAVEQ